MSDASRRSPALARALLRLLLPSGVSEAFAGDLEERFQRAAPSGLRAARRSYWKDVLSPTVLRLRREARGMHLPPGSPPSSARGDGHVRSLATDLRFALRVLAKAPAFTAVAVLSLALGIGPNTAIFSLVHAVLFRDTGVAEPETLVDIYTLTSDGQYFFNRYGNYELILEGTDDVFEDVTHHSIFAGRIEGPSGEAELVLGEMVSGSYFEVMGVPAALGRTFNAEEDATPGTHPVVVLSDDFWRSRFAADPTLIGGEIRLNGRPYTVIGVAPDEFRGRLAAGVGTDFWVPFSMYPHLNPSKMGAGDLTISGRVREGIAPGVAIAAIETIASRRDEELNAENPERRGRFALTGVALADVRLHPNFDGVVSAMAVLLATAVGLVLLIACVNLAGFLLSRAMDRRKEMAVRIAMGAGRGAILRQLLVESMVLAVLGAGLGLLLGQLAMRALTGMEVPLPVPVELEIGLNGPLLAFTAATTLVAALLFGLTPALEATRAPVAATLRDEAGSSGGKKKVGARALLVGSQMALSTVLIFGAALFMRSLDAASNIDVGFSTGPGAVATVETEANGYTREQRIAFVDEIERRLRAQAAVTEVGVTGRLPLALGTINTSLDIPGVEPPPDATRHVLETTPVTTGYFDAMGVRIVEGRAFEETDREGSQQVAILSRAAAERYWPGESALGKVLHRGGDAEDALVVVGVAGDVKLWSLSEPPRPYLYTPYRQSSGFGRFHVVARGSASPGDLAALLRTEARAIDPEIFLTDVGTVDDHLGYIYFLPRMAALLLSLIGALALALACIGLYGMVSYSVSRRTREMGIRLALGADRARVMSLVLGGGLTLVAVGGLVGIVASLALGQLAERFLYGVGGLDPLSLLAAPMLLAVVAALAAYVPARRASGVDPVRALRSE